MVLLLLAIPVCPDAVTVTKHHNRRETMKWRLLGFAATVGILGLALTAIFKARHCQVDVLGLTPAEFHVLLLVERLKESAFPAEISRWMMRKPATISRLLDRMEDRRLVNRVRNPNNEKTKQIVMTRKGKAALHRARTPDVIRLIMAMLSEHEFRQLWLLLEKLKAGALLRAEQMKARRMAKA